MSAPRTWTLAYVPHLLADCAEPTLQLEEPVKVIEAEPLLDLLEEYFKANDMAVELELEGRVLVLLREHRRTP